MTDSDGFVASVNDDGTAGVWIEAEDCHSPCDHEGDRCHHCATAASGILVTVKNSAGAGVGDRVTVTLRPGAVVTHLFITVGIPLSGAALGLLCLAAMGMGLSLTRPLSMGAPVLGLAVGIFLALSVYRRLPADHQPYISRVLAPASKEIPATPTVDPVCRQQVEPARARGSIGYQGSTYYFAHQECLQAFVKDPRRYV